jgi:hypothetical protein
VATKDQLPEFEEMETENLLISIAASSAGFLAAEIMLPEQNLVAKTGLFLLVAVPGLVAGEMAVKHAQESDFL